MEDIFGGHAKSEFGVFFTKLCQNLHDINSQYCVPDNDVSDEVDQWVRHMQQPLNPKRIRYGRALERLLGEPGTHYHACKYKDVDGLPVEFAGVALKNVIASNMLTDVEQTTFWKFIDNLTRTAFVAQQIAPPRVPTRTEVHENIRNRKLSEDNGHDNTVVKGFHTAFLSLAEDCGCKGKYAVASDDDFKALQKEWYNMCTNRFNEQCGQRHPDALQAISDKFPSMTFADVVSESTWKCITQLNGFTTVNQNVPVHMMGRIEDMAGMLANDIASGKVDMSSLNLDDIGKQVLAGCSETDMQNFAQNIGNILPALGNFQAMV